MTLLTIEEPTTAVRHHLWQGAHPFWALGFRPFYMLAAALAVVAIPAWLLRFFGWTALLPNITLGWHMHEMVFGFTVAVVVGFLMTAGRAWTGLWTPRRMPLAALAMLWLGGRAAMLAGPHWLAAVLDGLFLPLAAWAMFRVLRRAGNKRNMFLVALLLLLALANLLYHASVLGWLSLSLFAPIHAGILLIVVIEAVLGGRVIPMFTDNAVPGTKSIANPRADQISLALLVASSLAWIVGAPGLLTAVLCLAAAGGIALRLARWKPLRAMANPLLWILHVSYAWIVLGLILLGLAAIGVSATSTAFHALAVGSMAGLIVGMMTRTTLGHTGRMLKAGRAETAMYVLIQAGAVLRVLAGVLAPDWRTALLLASGLCWSLSFVVFLAVYTPYLWRARIDGKEG